VEMARERGCQKRGGGARRKLSEGQNV